MVIADWKKGKLIPIYQEKKLSVLQFNIYTHKAVVELLSNGDVELKISKE